MRKTTIKTSVTYTNIKALLYDEETNNLREWEEDIPATAKTEKGLEKLAADYLPENTKLIKIISSVKYQLFYEMDRETFMIYANLVI